MTFKEKIAELIQGGVSELSDITETELAYLTGLYLQECDTATQWEFITEPVGSSETPNYLADVLMKRRNGPFQAYNPADSLVGFMSQLAIHWGIDVIHKELEEQLEYKNGTI